MSQPRARPLTAGGALPQPQSSSIPIPKAGFQSSRVCPRLCNEPLNSTYRMHFPVHELGTRSRKGTTPTAVQVKCGTEHFSSTYRTKFTQHLSPQRKLKHPFTFMDHYPRSIPFEATTTYRAEHEGKVADARPARQRPQALPRVRFEANSTHRTNYQTPPSVFYAARKGEPPADAMLRVPFEAMSTYGAEYRRAPTPPVVPQRFRGEGTDTPQFDDRDFTTTSRQTYTCKEHDTIDINPM